MDLEYATHRRHPELSPMISHEGLPRSEYYESIRDQQVAAEVIAAILEKNFPESIHEDILRATGIDRGYVVFRRRRDPAFRDGILRAYENRCAVCGFTSRIDNTVVGVEAAHIKWHQARGPDEIPNGVALCSLHHKLFDRGMITFTDDYRVLVSEHATGSAMFEHMVMDFHGRELSMPIRTDYHPNLTFVAWHVREVFREPAREIRSA